MRPNAPRSNPKRVAETEQRQPLIRRLIAAIAFPGKAGALPLEYYAAAPEAALAIGQPLEERLRALIREVIEEVAKEGRAVIVAHAASMALAGSDGVLRILVTAPPSGAHAVLSRPPRSASGKRRPR